MPPITEEGRIARKADIDQLDFDLMKSPVVQAADWVGFTPYDWQQAIWMACWKPGAMVAARTCNESGKTSNVVPVLALSWASAFPGGLCVVTSASERQFEEQLIPSFDNMISGREGWRRSGNDIIAPQIDGLPPSKIVCFATKGGDKFEGFHNRVYRDENGHERFCPLLIIVDEAKTIKKDIFEAVGRCNPVVELRISTCGEDSGGFYDACMNKEGIWTTGTEWKGRYIPFKIPWTECPHLLSGITLERKTATLTSLGPNDPYVRSLLLAEFFRSGDYNVFDESDLMAIKNCMGGLTPYIAGQRKAFCDLSGGGDELTFGLREGNRIHPIVAWNQDSTVPPSKTAARYVRLFKQHNLLEKDIYCDNGGLGAQIINEMLKLGWKVNRVNFGAGPVGKGLFTTRIAELHWEFKELVQDQSIILPSDDKLYEQAQKRLYTMKNDDSNRIGLEDKRKGRREGRGSPDRLETVIGLLIGHEPFTGAGGFRLPKSPHRCGTPKEFFSNQKKIESSGDGMAGGWSNG